MNCHPTTQNQSAAIGILSQPKRYDFHDKISKTFQMLSHLSICFVMRTTNDSSVQFTNHTMLLVSCTSLQRNTGPLCSIVQWFKTAVASFPNASFILVVGKADDDAVWHPSLDVADVF